MAGNDSSRKPEKTLVAVKDRVYTNMLRLVFKEGGKVPDNLSGLYKSHAKAKTAIDYYNKGINRAKIYPRAPTEQKKDVKAVPKKSTTRSVNDNATKTEGIS